MALQGDEAPAGGVELAVERLQAVAAAKSGTPEELVALFVAAMRAHGLLARSVRHGYAAIDLYGNTCCETVDTIQFLQCIRHAANVNTPSDHVKPIGSVPGSVGSGCASDLMPSICRALDVLPLRPGRGAEASSRVAQGAPKRHKPDAAKGAAPRGHVEPIGPGNSKRAPAKRRRDAQQEADVPAEEGAAHVHPSISACLPAWPWHLGCFVALLRLILEAFAPG